MTVQTITLTVRIDHPAFDGHFPGMPVLPGVVLLDEMLRVLEIDSSSQHWQISAAKFLRPVRPGDVLTLEYERQKNGSVRFSVLRDTQPVASGVLAQSA